MFRFLSLCLAAASIAVAPSARAGFDAGYDAYMRGAWPLAVGELTPLADGGDARAQFYLGVIKSEGGHGVAKDASAALAWLRRAAGQGHMGAQFELYLYYSAGSEADGDALAERLRWGRAVTAQGWTADDHGKAQAAVCAIQMGLLYARGWVVPEDRVEAHFLLTYAGLLGRGDGAAAAADLESRMTAAEIARAGERLQALLARQNR